MNARDIVIIRLVIPAIRAEVESLTEEPDLRLVRCARWLGRRHVRMTVRGIDSPEARAVIGQASIDWAEAREHIPQVAARVTDIIAEAAIAALDPANPVLRLKDTEGAMEILEALMALSCSTSVRADRADCVEAILGDMDESEVISVAVSTALAAWPPSDLCRLAWASSTSAS